MQDERYTLAKDTKTRKYGELNIVTQMMINGKVDATINLS